MPYNIRAERLAYWYFRLNGFLTIENFILHDEARQQQRTEIDLVAFRFPHRREALCRYDDGEEWMEDSPSFAEKVTPFGAFVEVTVGRCKINGPWTDQGKGNLPRALRAFGVVPECQIRTIADKLYKNGRFCSNIIELALVSLGSEINPDLKLKMGGVLQIRWQEVKDFIFKRFAQYERIKREHPQWDADGHLLWASFEHSNRDMRAFGDSLAFVA